MLLCMQKYNYAIQHKTDKEMVLSDHIQHIQFSIAEPDAIWDSVECNLVYSILPELLDHTLSWPAQSTPGNRQNTGTGWSGSV